MVKPTAFTVLSPARSVVSSYASAMTDNEDRDDGANRDDHPAATLRWQLDDVLAQFEAQLTTGGDLLDDMRSSEPGTSLETFSAASSYWHERNLAFLGGAFGRAIGEGYRRRRIVLPQRPLGVPLFGALPHSSARHAGDRRGGDIVRPF